MRSNKIIFSILMVFALSSCDKIDNFKVLQWGEVDESKIRRALEDNAKEQNKQKLEEFRQKYDAYRDQKESLSTLLSSLKSEEKNNCHKQNKSEPAKRGKSSMNTDEVMKREMRFVRGLSADSLDPSDPLQMCLDNIRNLASIKDIENRMDKISRHMDDKNKFDREISNIVRDQVAVTIGKYAEGRYDLIVSNRNDSILYADKKIRLNVTDDVVEYIRNNKPDLTVKNFVEYSESGNVTN